MRSSTAEHRIIARNEGSRATLWSRHGTNFTDRLPKVAEAVCRAAKSALIDGDAVAFRPDGHFNGEGLRQRPLEKRRDALLRLVGVVDSILFSDAL